jgi:hypothetical protein
MQQPESNITFQAEAEAEAANLNLQVTVQDLNQIGIRVRFDPAPCNLAVQHLGIITTHVHRWYRFIPLNVRAFYEPEDMVADVVLHVHSQMLQYKFEKAKGTTWVYQVAHNCCRDIVQRYQRQMRNAATVEIDEPAARNLSQESFLRQREAFSAVERVIERSSDAAKDLIECLLSGDFQRKCDIPKYACKAIAELQETARSQNATADDFLLVFRHAT